MLAPCHIPVLLDESIQALGVQPGGRYIDCTVGLGGHTSAILERSYQGGQVLGIEADPSALAVARERVAPYGRSVLLVHDNFVNLKNVAAEHGFMPVHGILFDLGLSTLQLESGRGFSFQTESPLDMRVNPDQELSAADIVNSLSESELANLIWRYGEEENSRRIARRLVQLRPITTTGELVRAVEEAAGNRHGKIHPATKTFQALRIAVNHELENLTSALEQATELLGYEGRLVVISYHSLEDRIVKQFMQREARGCICPPGLPKCVCGHKPTLRIINKKVITPSEEEIEDNPRARSAKLRAAERIFTPDESTEKITKTASRVREHETYEGRAERKERGGDYAITLQPATLGRLRVAYSSFCLS
jgi:16S rRNA (cytosine1402-N4)-methyltransferase